RWSRGRRSAPRGVERVCHAAPTKVRTPDGSNGRNPGGGSGEAAVGGPAGGGLVRGPSHEFLQARVLGYAEGDVGAPAAADGAAVGLRGQVPVGQQPDVHGGEEEGL